MRKDKIGRRVGIAASLAMGALLAGCVAYPAGGYYGGYAPGPYYAPTPYAVVAPPVVGFWGGGYRYGGYGYGRRWR
jgi:hypothetical protein